MNQHRRRRRFNSRASVRASPSRPSAEATRKLFLDMSQWSGKAKNRDCMSPSRLRSSGSDAVTSSIANLGRNSGREELVGPIVPLADSLPLEEAATFDTPHQNRGSMRYWEVFDSYQNGDVHEKLHPIEDPLSPPRFVSLSGDSAVTLTKPRKKTLFAHHPPLYRDRAQYLDAKNDVTLSVELHLGHIQF